MYELYTLINDIKNAKRYIQEYINIHSSYTIQQQKTYVTPLNKLKTIYINEKNPEFVHKIDSLLNIINTNLDNFKNDSLFTLPKLLVNKPLLDEIETEYSINDIALEEIEKGFNYLKNNLYNQAKINFVNALSLNSKVLSTQYFQKDIFKLEDQFLYNAMLEDVSKDSTNNVYYFYLGVFEYHNKNYTKSTNYFLEYNKHFPGDLNGLLFLGDIKYLNNEWLDAIFYYYRCLNIDSNNFHANLALAKSLVKINDFEEAINILKYILRDNTNNYDLIFNLGFSYYNIEKYNDANKYLTQALLLNPEAYITYYYLGLSYSKQKLYKQALDALKKCVFLNSSFGLAHYELGKIYDLVSNNDLAIQHYKLSRKNESFDDLNYRLGHIYYNNSLFIEAMNPLKDYIVNNLKDWETLEILGETLMKIERYPEAIDIYSRLIEHNSNSDMYYYNLATAYYKLNDYDSAIQNYIMVNDLNDENHEVLVTIGTILNKNNAFEKSEEYFLKALDCGYPDKELLTELGISYGGQKKFMQSLIAFKEALKFSLEDPIIHYQIGIIYKELKIFNLAINHFLFYLEKNQYDGITLFLIGECHIKLNNYIFAIDYFNQSYKINNNIRALFNIGEAYEKLNDSKNAAKYFKSVIKNNPDHVKARIKLINIYLSLNKLREASKECEIIYMLDRSQYNSITYCKAN